MSDEHSQQVVVVDVRMPFLSMVVFLVKLAIASIPALIIVWILVMVLGGILAGLFGGMAMVGMTPH